MRRQVHHNIPKPKLGHREGSVGTGSTVWVGRVKRRGTSTIRRRRFPQQYYWGKAPKPRW